MAAVRVARTRGLRDRPPVQTIRKIQDGMRTSTYSRQMVIHRSKASPGLRPPHQAIMSVVKATFIAVMNTKAWAT